MTWKLVSTPAVVLALAAPLLANCKGGVAGAVHTEVVVAPEGPSCNELVTGEIAKADFHLPPASDAKVKALLQAALGLARAAPALERELIAACAELGAAAGMKEADLKADPDKGKGAERVCNNVSFAVSTMIRGARTVAKVDLSIDVEVPRCFSDINAIEKCLATCGAPVPAGLDVRAACSSGDVGGSCFGRCGGSCVVDGGEGAGACIGACSGKCDRDFRGTCGGKCDGTCDGAPSRGKPCKGICDGKCSAGGAGSCGGKCEGRCAGGWEPKDPAHCPGTCSGSCAGQLVTPLCSGDFAPAGADPLCKASCQASALVAARCPLPAVRVTAKGGKQTKELQRLLAGIQSAVPKIVRLQQGFGQRLPRAIETVVAASIDWTNAMATTSPKALFCVRTGADWDKEAETTIAASVVAGALIPQALKAGEPPPAQAPVD